MKKILLLLILISSFAYGQTLTNTQIIGQPSRNQEVGNGLQINDTALFKGLLRLPVMTTVGGATDSVLSRDPVTGIIELRPQGGGSGSVDTANFWNIRGNTGTTISNFAGTIDKVRFPFRAWNREHMELDTLGQLRLRAGLRNFSYDTTASNTDLIKTANIFIGDSAGYALRSTTIDTAQAYNNVGLGFMALRDMVNGWGNTAIGTGALTWTFGEWGSAAHNPGTAYGSGYENTAIGFLAMHLNRTGYENTAVGTGALLHCFSCQGNVAVGLGSLAKNLANGNVAVGTGAMAENTTGTGNTTIGGEGLKANTSGTNNTALGSAALRDNQTGFSNTAVGNQAGLLNVSGVGNTYYGTLCAVNNNGSRNIFIGSSAGLNSTALNDRFILDFGGFSTTATEDTTKAFLYGILGAGGVSDSSTHVLELNGKFRVNDGTNTVIGKRPYLANINGLQLWSTPDINTTAGDAATIDKVSGRFRKDTSGATFTLTNSFITANSIIHLTQADAALDATATRWTVSAGAGSATIAFDAAPTANLNMNFTVEN